MNRISNVFASFFAAFILMTINPAMAEGIKPWSESEVLSLSDELFSAARRLRIECRSSPPKFFDESSGRHIAFQYHVRHFLSVSTELNNALEEGKGKIETLPIYETLTGMRKDLTGYAEMPGGAWIPVQKAVAEVDKNLTGLGAYYSRE